MLKVLNYMKKTINKVLLIFFIIVLLYIIIINNNVQASTTADITQKFEFTESTEEFNSPDMGIYRPTAIQCKAEGEWPNTKIQYANGLVHLRIGLKDFTKAGNGVKDYDITEEHINKLNQYMRSSKTSRGNSYYKICV